MTDITPYLNRLDILNETAHQVMKDFAIAGKQIKFSGNSLNAYEELHSQIVPVIENFLKKDARHFYNLMYRIDIGEAQIKEAVAGSKDKSVAEIITSLILQRELIKVVFRKQYSG